MAEPLFTTAVLMILRRGVNNAVQMADIINTAPEHKALREKWGGKVTSYQVYASMSGLRHKWDRDRNCIEPIGKTVGRTKFYTITRTGQRELDDRILKNGGSLSGRDVNPKEYFGSSGSSAKGLLLQLHDATHFGR